MVEKNSLRTGENSPDDELSRGMMMVGPGGGSSMVKW